MVGHLRLFHSMPPFLLLIVVVITSVFCHGSAAAPGLLYTDCPNTTFVPATNGTFRSNLNALLEDLSMAANTSSTPGFDNSTVGILYGIYLCRGDVDPTTCRDCVGAARVELSQSCPRAKEAVTWYDQCMVRYSNQFFFGQLNNNLSLQMWNTQNVTGNATTFNQVLSRTLENVTNEAARGGPHLKFQTQESKFNDFQTVYVLGQCTPDLSSSDCYECLQECILYMPMGNRQGGRTLFYSCNLRYEIYLFYETKTGSPQNLLSTYCPDPAVVDRFSINALLSNLSSAADQSTDGFREMIQNATPSSATKYYGMYLCRGDVSSAICRECVATAASILPQQCPSGNDAVILYDECMIRYSNEYFFGQTDLQPLALFMQTVSQKGTDLYMGSTLVDVLRLVENQAEEKRENGMMFGTASQSISGDDNRTVYMLGQCTSDISPAHCKQCLNQSFISLQQNYTSQQSGKVYLFSCNLRYEMYPFYSTLLSPEPEPEPEPEGNPIPPNRNKRIIVVVASSVISLIMLFLSLALWFIVSKRKAPSPDDLNDISTVESLQMDFNTIRDATHNFSIDRKLGQGGFGPVYKGTLENGQEIAVKRLSDDSGQGIVEFKTEVLLVAKLQHRNLVKLLGFCVTRKEKILVYEFLPNSSLDKILFDPTQRMSLNWEMRFKIICGIAKGLMYLHEDSRLRVIHRDLKSSNILLDEAMNPKISDFGLAKFFGVDQTQAVTESIAGTCGYMAPEYLLMGHYSIKSDVYSFGIILLEVVSGQRNKYINRPLLEEALLYRVWSLWHAGKALELVDEALDKNYSKEDVMKCIHIGLLCIQENATKRPNMISIVAALGGQSITLPLPTPPNFFSDSNQTTSMDNSSGVSSRQTVSTCGTSEITEVHGR